MGHLYNNRDKILRANDKQTSQTLLRGLKILEFIARGGSGLSIRQLAGEVKLPRSIVHRLISTLEDAGYLQKNSPMPGYRLGTKLWWLGCAAIQELEIKEVARPHLEDLAAKTKELVNIAILDGKEVLYIDKIDSSQSVRAHIPIGGRAPAYCVATGKAILAHLEDEEVIKIISSAKKVTDKTVTGIDHFRDHLAEIRRRGYSINLGEYHDDVGGIAAPIRDGEGNVVAAVGITFPLNRGTSKNILRFGSLTMEAAAAMSRKLGYADANIKDTILIGRKSNTKVAVERKEELR